MIQRDPTLKTLTWVITIVTAPFILGGIFILFFLSIFNNDKPNIAFNKKIWDANKFECFRQSNDIISNKMLLGKTKNEVRLILGNEDNADSAEYNHYKLGELSRGMGWSEPFFEIEYQNSKVIKVEQYDGRSFSH